VLSVGDVQVADAWRDLSIALSSDYCAVSRIAQASSLDTAVKAGSLALPKINKCLTMMKTVSSRDENKSGEEEWMGGGEQQLPCAINLGKELAFHSSFVCPVSRQQTSEKNPPMLLQCGHVLSNDAMMKIAKSSGRFKCPTCPKEQTVAQARAVRF